MKVLSVDGVSPSLENISDQKYPLITTVYCVTLESNHDENVKKLLDYILSEEGQEIVEASGYAPINKK